MNYLFFDIECATCKNGGKLCEFGYVITDPEFNVLKSENFLINPKSEFDPFVINKMLHYKKSEYLGSPVFSEYSAFILGLLSDKNNLLIGHTVKGDFEHIGDDCIRYNNPVPDFEFIDIVEFYKLFSGKKNSTALVKMCEELGIVQTENAHTAVCDAVMTMSVTKALCEKFGKTVSELSDEVPSSKGKLTDYESTVRKKLTVINYRKELMRSGVAVPSKRDISFLSVYASAIRGKRGRNKPLRGKTFAISSLFIIARFEQVKNLIWFIKKNGGKFSAGIKNANCFIDYPATLKSGEPVYSEQLAVAERLKSSGKKLSIIDFNEFCTQFGVTDEFLNRTPKAVEKAEKAFSSAPVTA